MNGPLRKLNLSVKMMFKLFSHKSFDISCFVSTFSNVIYEMLFEIIRSLPFHWIFWNICGSMLLVWGFLNVAGRVSQMFCVSLWSVNTRLDMNDMGVRIVQSLFLKCTPKSPQCPECWVFSVFPVLVPVPSCVRQQRLGMNEVSGAFRDWAVLRSADM